MLETAEPVLDEPSRGECWISTMEFDEHDHSMFLPDEEANLFRSPTEEEMIAFNDSRQARETK